MSAHLNLDSILTKVKKLNKREQITLLQKISSLIQAEISTGEPVNLMDLSGLGSSLWKNVDIDRYIDNERQW